MTQLNVFDTTIQKTNEILKAIEERFGWTDRQESYHALRGVLFALRDRLTVEHAAGLAAQLPQLVRGIYYEGWNPARTPVKMDRDEFLDRIAPELPEGADPAEVVRGVLAILASYATPEELRKIRATLPADVAEIVSEG